MKSLCRTKERKDRKREGEENLPKARNSEMAREVSFFDSGRIAAPSLFYL